MRGKLYGLVVILTAVLALLIAVAWRAGMQEPMETEPTASDMATSEASVPSAQISTPPDTIPSTAFPSTAPPTEATAPEPLDMDFVRIGDYISNVRVELRYATEDNFTDQVIYDFSEAWLRYGTVKKLMQVADVLENLGLGLVIWDAYRPVYAQQKLWDVCPDPNYVSPPGTGRQTHCRGIAVDLTLYDLETGALLEMPSDFDEFSALGDRDYSDCTGTARENALILEKSMENGGFQPYAGEWWHFADTEEYPLEEAFDPAL